MSGAASVDRMRHQARERLLAERTQGGWWKGELSSSALSTATACAALALARTEGDDRYLAPGLTWLAQHQNGDGGYGDTTCSPSNLSTSALCWMALGFGQSDSHRRAKQSVEQWLSERLGGLQPEDFASGLREVYAEDHTFAIPILVACTVGGAFPQHQSPWSSIARLPFELAALPRGLFKWLGLSVVSYALPALIAIGQAIEYHNPSRNPFSRLLRRVTRSSTLRTLESIQPPGGGFLEATPLTSFVVLSLVSCGHTKHPVVLQGLDFLRRSIRSDGSWPIDSDLATWLTTLAVNALCAAGDQDEALSKAERRPLSKWLMGQQHVTLHPYTGAAPGGWAWTDLPGGVPDADDTAGALLALQELGSIDSARAKAGALWLRDLQNRDGGIPTFCRGWGKLPFDASCPDLTAHALRAWLACEKPLLVGGDRETVIELGEARQRAQEHLVRTQQGDGTWTPLWFGNQQAANKENPVYGTSRVLRAAGVPGNDAWLASLERALVWLLSVQNNDGGYGGGEGLSSTVEETALALEALADAGLAALGNRNHLCEAITRGMQFLASATSEGTSFDPQPIGLYFAQLWYSERLYPLIFTVSALESCTRFLKNEDGHA